MQNRVQSIENRAVAASLSRSRIVIGRQMEPAKLERVMLDFTEGTHNVLVATTIIESGIDLPASLSTRPTASVSRSFMIAWWVGQAEKLLTTRAGQALSTKARARLAVIKNLQSSVRLSCGPDLELEGRRTLGHPEGHVQAVGLRPTNSSTRPSENSKGINLLNCWLNISCKHGSPKNSCRDIHSFDGLQAPR